MRGLPLLCVGLFALMFLVKAADAPKDAKPDSKPPVTESPTQRTQSILRKEPLLGRPADIFDGDKFPKIAYLNPELMEMALGPLTISVRFFDSQWNEVSAPKGAGRYGAVAEVTTKDGISCVRRVTLFKAAHPYSPVREPYRASVTLPDYLGLPGTISQTEAWNVDEWVNGMFREAARSSPAGAILAAGLSDLAADPALHGFSVMSIDDRWWSELDRRLGKAQDYPYAVRLPADYEKDAAKRWPLLVYLHGSGERGADLKLVEKNGPIAYIDRGHALPMIAVAPQCAADEWWEAARVARLVDQLAEKYRVDPKRIYLTGLSMGGYGTFDTAAQFPDRFAAIAPDAGGANPALAPRLAKIPTWIFHGAEDDVVPTRYSVDIAEALKKLNAPVKLTLLPKVGHGQWTLVYDNPELYAWMLQQAK